MTSASEWILLFRSLRGALKGVAVLACSAPIPAAATTYVETYLIRDRVIRIGDPMVEVRSLFRPGEHVGSDVDRTSPDFPPTYHLRIAGQAVSIRFSVNDNAGTVTNIALDDPRVAAYEKRSLCTADTLGSVSSLVTYDGVVDGSQVRMTLTRSNNQGVIGRYFYKKYLKDIDLRASIGEDGRSILLTEYDTKGDPVAVFAGHFQATDPAYRSANLGCDVFSGVWKSERLKKEVPFRMQLRFGTGGTLDDRYGTGSTEEFERKVQRLRQAVVVGDREAVADAVRYPLHVTRRGSRTVIQNRREFLADYSQVMTPELVRRFAEATPKAMFRRDLGVRLDDIWLDYEGKVIDLR